MFKLQIKAEQNSSICVYFEGEYACTRLRFHQQDFLLWISVFFPSLLTFSYFNDSTVVHCGTLWPNLVGAAGPWVERSGSKTWPVHCDVFLDKTLYSRCLSPTRSITGC